ncbi:hypothetical protein MF069_36485 [Paenibacillus mucilaginosus]|uniref:hypothetical protein n=1 Tax=Paenibacillus mucilaginosus TaxID=61624 RepID=UPI001EEFB4FE|nr:hypothetical protein [Paenibacillus mucilaginosus]MCG7218199.1 hypothetical protein [Paenibacillus mucilaginosus]
MNLAIIDGFLGAGKTLGMSLLSLYFQSQSNCTLYSNYGLAGSKEFTHYEQFLDVAKEPSSIICLDEAHTDLDSRSSTTNVVKYFTHLIFYLRKLRCTLMLSTPSIENLDARVRLIANLYVMVSKDKKYFYYDMYDMQKLRHLKRYKIRQADAFSVAAKAYDTYNIVLPVEFPSEKKEFNEFLPILKKATNDYYSFRQDDSDALGTESPGEELTKFKLETPVFERNVIYLGGVEIEVI